MTWRVATSLDVLLAEINAAAPNRSKVSDGSIGDAAHASRDSDHNPWVIVGGVGVVRARDFTHDPIHDCDAGAIAESVRLLGITGHPALGAGAYVIWNRRIASATYDWTWRDYSGSNPHDHHCHVSVSTAASGFDSTAPWRVMEEEDPMAEYGEQILTAIKRLEEREKNRDASERERAANRHRAILALLDKLADDVADKAARDQVRRLRTAVEALADPTLDEPTEP